jgi:hypothetical protein
MLCFDLNSPFWDDEAGLVEDHKRWEETSDAFLEDFQ